jgi:polyisoprenoid-binding protein YceI
MTLPPRIVCLACSLILLVTASSSQDWEREVLIADRAHSSITFRASHWGIVDIVGWFEDFDIDVEVAGTGFSDAVVTANVRTASVRMPNAKMAGNLRGMFDVAAYPHAIFKSTRVERADSVTYRITGDLTMKGVTVPVTWEAVFNGFGYPPGADPGFTAKTVLNRLDFGIGDREVHGSNGELVVGEKIEVTCNVRLVVPD